VKALAIVVLMLTAGVLSADAVLLPAGTIITRPDGTVTTLTASGFLLDRADMNAAVKAMADLAIDEKEIAALHGTANSLQSRLDSQLFWKILIGGASAVAGGLLDHYALR
jgi:hypothetical protein